MNHVAVHIGETAFDAVVIVAQALVIEPQQMQHRRVQIVDRADVLRRAVTEFVGRAVAVAMLDAGARQPHREAVGIVVAALVLRWNVGIRPNSVTQTTSVSSSKPRCLRSRRRAAHG